MFFRGGEPGNGNTVLLPGKDLWCFQERKCENPVSPVIIVFKLIQEIKSGFAEGMSTCYISLLIAVDKGLLLEMYF